MIRRIVLAALLALLPSIAMAQGALLQGGPWKPGHAPQYVGSGNGQAIVQDSGPASGGVPGVGFSEMGLTVRGTGTAPYANVGTGPLGTNFCDYDAPINNATGYHYLCFSPNAQGGGLMAYGSGGTAAQLPFSIGVNGTLYQFPFSIAGILGPGSTTVGDFAVWNNLTGTLLKDVSQVTLAQLPTMTANSLLGNGTSGSATPTALTTLPSSFTIPIATTTFTGQLGVANGGTGDASLTLNGVVYGNGAGALSATSQGAANTVLTANAGPPSFSAQPTLGSNGATAGKLTLSGAASGSGVLQVASAAGSGIVFQLPSANGSANNVLSTNGSGVTSWTTDVSSFNGRTGAVTPTTGDYTLAQATTNQTGALPTAGQVGEQKTCTGTGVVLNNGTPVNICSTALTAGGWECEGTDAQITVGGTTASFYTSLNTTSVTMGARAGFAATFSPSQMNLPPPPLFIQTAGTPTVFMVDLVTGAGAASDTANGTIICHRIN